jgi:hypothetical protein
MVDERQTERLYRKIDGFLKWTGLFWAVKGTPSLLAAIFASIVALECIFIPVPMEYRVLFQPGLLILGVVVGVISVKAGDFWDRKVFDPRYGLKGAWLERSPWALFPPGSDLRYYRNLAIEKLKRSGAIDPETGERVYRESKKIVERSPKRWDRIDDLNALSKFARNFILPAFVTAFVSFGILIWKVLIGNYTAAMLALLATLVFLTIGFALFIPYFSFRVEHMIRLYDEATTVRTTGHGRSESI